MIQPNELRIGNYVNTENGVKRVSTVSVDGWSMHKVCETIPLTEEWLLKFGFVYNGWNYDFENLRFHAQSKSRNGEFFNTEFYIKKGLEMILVSFNINYVHQLQNIYFALTGEELL